ncbi:MAG TPA: 2-succinyl-5-enolpyruvyl-6-hydroxy-3-cyclohexene-1-carboxylic-acid synthase [Dehalococcoidia bacterium]|nr:2-succinyl-5-enolpyruvyl-6-hydroxy-3-cyclohexene-1-carboxylic-acid synthase [Dehalococcoidia bacterium]
MSETTPLSHAETLAQYLGVFVDELVAAGLEHVCLCPGSRSTPLALTFARHPGIKVWTHLDERSCAYFALGMAKASRKPIAILCSSGTAAVNFAPAVVESYHASVPLVVLTADRPQELRDLGANQTIDQVRLYGGATKWFVEMPLPEASDSMLRYARMIASRAMSEAVGNFPGPVHLNFPFREPLVPTKTTFVPEKGHTRASGLFVKAPSRDDFASLIQAIKKSRAGLIVAGPQVDPDEGSGIDHISTLTGFPVLADPLSHARFGGDPSNVVSLYDNYLRDESLADRLRPDLVLRFGAQPTSKPLQTYLMRHADVSQILVSPNHVWRDPDLAIQKVIVSDVIGVVRALYEYRGYESKSQGYVSSVARSWTDAWDRAEEITKSVLASVIETDMTTSEPSVFHDFVPCLPREATIVAGNSMPVRDLDSFFPGSSRFNGRILANRGASGIDGVVSTALGVSAVSTGPTVLVIGDLSFYHDMNGLLAAKRFGLKATIVLINNDGGGIFSFLPQNDDQEHFEQLFGTPHGLDFEPVAQLYALGWTRVKTREEYRAALKASFESDGVNVIEVKTDRVENLKLHQRIWEEVAKAVAPIAAKASP